MDIRATPQSDLETSPFPIHHTNETKECKNHPLFKAGLQHLDRHSRPQDPGEPSGNPEMDQMLQARARIRNVLNEFDRLSGALQACSLSTGS
jgi:hypothetical protein